MIVEAIVHSDRHVTAEEIYAQVRERTRAINIATVYRTLEVLLQQGLVSRVDLQDGQWVYTPNSHGPHMHLVCRQCGELVDAEHVLIAPLIEDLQAHYGFRADALHISIPGLCRSCAGANNG
jgi:Fur family ferric uptake transcriptional regulator